MLAFLLSISVSLVAATRPNLVMMVIDDVGWADVGYHGSDFPTPNIDLLAKTGVRLEKYYVQQVCSPTRSALMTGRYPFHTGMQHCTTIAPGSTAKIPAAVPTIAEVLRDAGYSTAAIGKWHLGADTWDATPTGRGFASHAGYFQGQTDYYNKTLGGDGVIGKVMKLGGVGFDFWRNRTAAWEEYGKYSMDFYMREAERILDERDTSKPLFLYFAHQQVHLPLEGPPEKEYATACANVGRVTDLNGKQRHIMCTMMNRLDKAIGDFVAMLKDRNMWEDTVLWVTSDNGGMTQYQPSFPASASSNFPLRGGKATLFEGGVRAVSFVTGGQVPSAVAGTEVHGLLQHVDIPATFAALADTKLAGTDGMNIWDVITTGAQSPRREVPLNVDVSGLAKLCTLLDLVPSGPGSEQESLELMGDQESGTASQHMQNFSAIIQDDWKLINGWQGFYDGWWSNNPYTHTEADWYMQGPAMMGGDSVWLFNLAEDPEERQNVAGVYPEIVLRMQQRLRELSDPSKGYMLPQNNLPHPRAFPRFNNGTWAPWRSSGLEEKSTEYV